MTAPHEHGNSTRPQIELRCRVSSTMLGLMREFVCSVARHLGFSENQVAEIEISVDEACANAIEHAYSKSFATPEDTEQLVTVEIEYSGEMMTIRVTDRGIGNPGDFGTIKKLEQYLDASRDQYRGLGFLLMERFMDRVDVKSAPGRGTTVEMTKLRNK